MIAPVLICFACFAWLIALLRQDQISVGLPVAYLFALLFIHVPGAVVHLVAPPGMELTPSIYTETGIWLTAIGSICFVLGVWAARARVPSSAMDWQESYIFDKFAVFCVVGGLLTTYSLRLLINIPSIGAVIEKGGGIWVLGVIIGLSLAFKRQNKMQIVVWVAVMSIFPILTLLLGGFLSFGSTPVFIILASLVVATSNHRLVAVLVPVVSMVFLLLFLSYFNNRDNIRREVWGGHSIDSRLEQATKIFSEVKLFDRTDEAQLSAIDQRLNQNFFVGKAAARIEAGQVTWLYGRSFAEGLMSLVPRILWPAKPVYGGSPKIITEMTGFQVNKSTSYGVGNVMELYINFGIPSLCAGFLMLGFAFGWLDKQAANALRVSDVGTSILYFMPAAAMIHPNGSLVELASGGAAAWLAAIGWRFLWRQYYQHRDHSIYSHAGEGG